MKKIGNYFSFLRNYLNILVLRVFIFRKMEKKKYYASLCTIFKNEAKYLKEWVEYHLVVGFEHFYIYNNFSTDNYLEVLEPYIKADIVTLVDWPYTSGQNSAYTNCVEKFSFESNFIGFVDADEFAVPVKESNIGSWLKKFEKFPCVLGFFRNFGSSGVINEDTSIPVIEQFTNCTDFVSPSMFINTRFSKISKPFTVAHFCKFKFFGKVCPENGAFFFKISKKLKNPDFQFNHYYCKSYEYFRNKKIPNGDVWKVNLSRTMNDFFRVEEKAIHNEKIIYKYLSKLKTFDLEQYLENRIED